MTVVLIVDDEVQFRGTLARALKKHDYRAIETNGPDSLASTVAIQKPDVILLDLMFESGDNGLDACRQLRTWSSVPVIILTVCSDETVKLQAFDAGADDYLVKPFGVQELMARIRAIQRRLEPRLSSSNPIIRIGDLSIDLHSRNVSIGDSPIYLTNMEYGLLKLLALGNGQLLTYETLLMEIFGKKSSKNRVAIRSLAWRLRQKLGEDLSNPQYILTEVGIGYRLNIRSTEAHQS